MSQRRKIPPQLLAELAVATDGRPSEETLDWGRSPKVALGPRVTFEVIRSHPDLEDDVDRRRDHYAVLENNVLQALGADVFPYSAIRAVENDG